MITRNNQEQKVVRQTFAWTQLWPEDWTGWLRPLQLLPIPHPLIPFTKHTKPSHSSIRHTMLNWYWISPLYSAAQFRRNCSIISGLQGLWPMLQLPSLALPRLIWHDTAPPACPCLLLLFALRLETSTNCTLSALGQGNIIKLCRGKIFIGVA